MPRSLTHEVIDRHLVTGRPSAGEEIGIRIDQTLTQDATGTLVMLALEAMGIDRVQTELSAQYVDHNLMQVDSRNPDDHRFLRSACARFGVWYSRPGNGVSHPVHQQRFGRPGSTLLGSDSHTPAAGAIGCLAIGAGGIEVARAMAGEPYYLPMPEVWGVELTGALPPWVSAKDVILEMLRRHGVEGGVGRVIEYHGDGLADLSVMDRHVIANMGTELGATSTLFPSDERVRDFFAVQGRADDWVELAPDPGVTYEHTDRIDLSKLVPLIAMPSSPGNVVPVAEVAGEEISQAYVGSSANPGYRDFAVVAEIVKHRSVHPRVSLDINPTSRQILENLARDGHLFRLIRAGARIHQAGCNGCIGMGQAPATDTFSLRTVPRNFPGRSGTREDKVCLVSPETAAVSALTGVITDPRLSEVPYPEIFEPDAPVTLSEAMLIPPVPSDAPRVELDVGPNIAPLPELEPPPAELTLPVLLSVGDDISTDEILPAGVRVLPLRSNVPAISDFVFEAVDPDYVRRARESRDSGGHAIVAGANYGQGSSREHAALAPRFLGLRLVLARSFARIHHQNLVNYGVLPLTFNPDAAGVEAGQTLRVRDLEDQLRRGPAVRVEREGTTPIEARHHLSPRQVELLLVGGVINAVRRRRAREGSGKTP